MQSEASTEEQREAVRAVAAAMTAVGRNPEDYTAEVRACAGGLLEVHARHSRHPPHWSGRGDPCGRCCVARYNLKTRAVLEIVGVR